MGDFWLDAPYPWKPGLEGEGRGRDWQAGVNGQSRGVSPKALIGC
jgi:hypothetical protein